jgi:F-type H+-transporting ATPase subunit c
MDVEAARLIGAGLAAIGIGAAATGVGTVFGSYLQGALRNPGAAAGERIWMFVGFAAAELLGLIAFVVAILALFG